MEKPVLYLSRENKNWGIAVYGNGEIYLINLEDISKDELEKKFDVKKDENQYNELFKGYLLSQTG